MTLTLPRLGGTARVYCVHDREKRVVVTEEQVAALGADLGVRFDRARHETRGCVCCANLYVDDAADPGFGFCHACRGPSVHPNP